MDEEEEEDEEEGAELGREDGSPSSAQSARARALARLLRAPASSSRGRLAAGRAQRMHPVPAATRRAALASASLPAPEGVTAVQGASRLCLSGRVRRGRVHCLAVERASAGSGGAQGDARPRNPDRYRREHEYDYEDEFIDDSEMLEYLGGDRRRTKHSGFFVNKARRPLGRAARPAARTLRRARLRVAHEPCAPGSGAALEVLVMLQLASLGTGGCCLYMRVPLLTCRACVDIACRL